VWKIGGGVGWKIGVVIQLLLEMSCCFDRFISVGKPKTSMIASCRQAIKTSNMSSLFKIIKAGVQ
jgi:hypothetical protein